MPITRVVFDCVWKKFFRGERHDSLRDLIPAVVGRLLRQQPEQSLRKEEFWAIQDVSFEVRAGEALGIIGGNGAGKSTILKLLSRILKPTRGSCSVIGRSGALIEIAAGFHADLTGRENVYLQGAIMGMRRHEISARFDAIVDFAGVERFIDTPVKRYSSGMNARLGFSIAAHLNPAVLLIDEVLAVGDRAFQEKCYSRMRQFRAEGIAIVFVSHNLPAVAQLCNRVLLLEEGTIARLGTPMEVISAYCGGTGSVAQDGATLAATLRRRDSARSAEAADLEPGAHLSLDVSITFKIAVRDASVGVVVWELTRELYVYGASSNLIGIPTISAEAGETRHFTFSFDANLTRGVYAVEVNVVDLEAQRFLAVARGIRHFQVVERVSYDGIANLYLTGHETESALSEPYPNASGYAPESSSLAS